MESPPGHLVGLGQLTRDHVQAHSRRHRLYAESEVRSFIAEISEVAA